MGDSELGPGNKEDELEKGMGVHMEQWNQSESRKTVVLLQECSPRMGCFLRRAVGESP